MVTVIQEMDAAFVQFNEVGYAIIQDNGYQTAIKTHHKLDVEMEYFSLNMDNSVMMAIRTKEMDAITSAERIQWPYVIIL